MKILVDKYLDGETSLAEERTLAEYLKTCEVLDDELRSVKMMLNVFVQERSVVVPAKPQIVPIKRRSFTLSLRRIASVVAAACVVVIAVFIAYDYTGHKSEDLLVCYVDGVMVDDQAQALKESERVVGTVFNNINMALLTVNSITSGVSK